MRQGSIIGGILLALIIGYGLVKAGPLLRGPVIRIDSITTADTGLTILSGTAIHTKTLTLNGGTLLIDENDAFSKSLTLPRGDVILSLTATDRFGREQTTRRDVIIP
ncbi:MAG: hypothetical protein JWN49_439 [Parcubacteria group bacterium]|nr:hypothetical protein [Parcubacteria group bacterium]